MLSFHLIGKMEEDDNPDLLFTLDFEKSVYSRFLKIF